MSPYNRLFILFLVISCFIFFSMYLPIPIQEVRGLNVDGFKDIIGKKDKELALLQFAEREGFNYLLLYDLQEINESMYDLTDLEESQALAQFIKKAKSKFGIMEIGAVGETAQSFEAIDQYNKLYEGSIFFSIDVYNLEFEFWNKEQLSSYYCPTYLAEKALACKEKEAYDFYFSELKKVKALTHPARLKCETYIGQPSRAQCKDIGQWCDRVLIHYYQTSDIFKSGKSMYQFHDYRIPALAPEEGVLQILPIFSVQENQKSAWIEDHPKNKSYPTYHKGQKGFQNMTGKWKEHINIQGAQWFQYTELSE